jgi:hypothetical protein
MRFLIFIILCSVFFACDKSYVAKQTLSEQEYRSTLTVIAPYVIGKSDEFSFEERFRPENRPFYENFIKLTGAELKYYEQRDSAALFFFQYRDLTSLFEHYRGLGGYYRTNENGEITFLNLRYHTPRLTMEEMEERGKILFEEMLQTGDVKNHLKNKQFVQTPNDDFYYNTKLNRWDYTENSSWKFLEEARQQAEPDSIH